MIAEKLSIKFDIQRMQDYFYTHVKPLTPVFQSNMFGGWSILSNTGDYRDGFQLPREFVIYHEESGDYTLNYAEAKIKLNYAWPEEHIHPTQVCTEYIAEVIQAIQKLGLKPHRARWTLIPPHSTTIWHQDAPNDTYSVRLHIPVITNQDCAFETKQGKIHMVADGSCYLVAVNCMHKAYNLGNTERIHIIMDVIDEVGASQFHQVQKYPILYYLIKKSFAWLMARRRR